MPDPISSPVGRLEWIGVRPADRQPMVQVPSVLCDPASGLDGDCYDKPAGKRQVTIIQFETLRKLADKLNRASVSAELLRRNLAVSGEDITTLIGREFSIGAVRFFGTDDCPPCGRMDETLGPGGREAMIGLGGITARIVTAGEIRVGDLVVWGSVPTGLK